LTQRGHRFGLGHFSLHDPHDEQSVARNECRSGRLFGQSRGERKLRKKDARWWVVVMPRRPRVTAVAFVEYSNEAPRCVYERHRQPCQRLD
jgi:hypothetical protein